MWAAEITRQHSGVKYAAFRYPHSHRTGDGGDVKSLACEWMKIKNPRKDVSKKKKLESSRQRRVVDQNDLPPTRAASALFPFGLPAKCKTHFCLCSLCFNGCQIDINVVHPFVGHTRP